MQNYHLQLKAWKGGTGLFVLAMAALIALLVNATDSRASEGWVLSPTDLAYGESQVELMLKDRPEMATMVRKGDAIWDWSARQFAGEWSGCRYHWIDKAPTNDVRAQYACHQGPSARNQGWITIQKAGSDSHYTPDRMWELIIFELLNTKNDDAARDLVRQARNHKISKAHFVRSLSKLEYQTMLDLSCFQKEIWLPFVRSSGGQSNWSLRIPDHHGQFLEVSHQQDPRYLDFYNRYYDQVASENQNDTEHAEPSPVGLNN